MRATVLFLSLAMPAGALSAAEPGAVIPLAARDLFAPFGLSGPNLSPDGRHLALVSRARGARAGAVIVDLSSMVARPFVRFKNGDVSKVWWLNDKRLAYTTINVPKEEVDTTSGLFAMDLDRSNERGLSPAIADRGSFLGIDAVGDSGLNIEGTGSLTKDFVHVVVRYRPGEHELGRVNSRTLAFDGIAAPSNALVWLVADDDEVRAAVTRKGANHEVHFRSDRVWAKLGSFDPLSDQAFTPVRYADGKMTVRAYGSGDRAAIYRYDLAKGAIEATPFITSPTHDIDGRALTQGGKMIGYRVTLEAEETVWFDPAMAAAQKEVDALLPATVNRLSPPQRPVNTQLLVEATSPAEPGAIYIYDSATKKIVLVGSAAQGLERSQLANTSVEYYITRDGVKRPLMLTFPKGAVKKNLPAVVLLNPSPWTRNTRYGFDARAQFLASRGYLVIEPEARGTDGYGRANVKAGVRQLGRGMQDDIADSARWAAAQGYADPARVCIAGAVYGGYAALMGVLRDPELFRCAVSMAGIVDLGLMFDTAWAGFHPPATAPDFKTLVGDPVADKAYLAAVSPLVQASRIRQPVLLAYGTQDTIVPDRHGRLLFDQLKLSSPASEFHLYGTQGDKRAPIDELSDMWDKIALFLARHTGVKQQAWKASQVVERLPAQTH